MSVRISSALAVNVGGTHPAITDQLLLLLLLLLSTTY
jgi:hypothetical protein